jgi:hypothetical protein
MNIKQLFFLVILLAVLGFAAFVYRSTLERPLHGTNESPTSVACTAEAKICPDGSSVGRTGPSCDFATCPFPNTEIPQAGIAFVAPAGYKVNPGAIGSDTSLIGVYEKAKLPGSDTQQDAIVVRRYPIPAGKDANSVMLAQTMYESSGMQPTSMQAFTPVIINGKTYQMIVVERFEAVVHVEYYLPRERDVLRFEALQHNVMNWSEPTLNVRSLKSVADLETMLGTLQSNEPAA